MHPVIEVNNGTYIMGRGGSVSPTDRVFKDNIIDPIRVVIILGHWTPGVKQHVGNHMEFYLYSTNELWKSFPTQY
jgi:hypothetical protein